MYAPLLVRSLNQSEQDELKQGLRSRNGFKLRRCQILLASTKGQPPSQIAQQVGCSVQTVGNVIRAFEQHGLECLSAKSSRPKTVQPTFDATKCKQLRTLLHRSPREFGKARSIWTSILPNLWSATLLAWI